MSTEADDLSHHSALGSAATPHAERPEVISSGSTVWRLKVAGARDAVSAGVGVLMGLVPHVMHHIGLLAGAALVTGVIGNAAFFAVGLVLSIPLLRRLYRRFHTWLAPTVAIVVFAALFSLSALVIGPAISGDPASDTGPTSPAQTPSQDHGEHHSDG